MAKVAFITLGCKVNQYDTKTMMEELLAAGWQLVGLMEKPDLIVVNSCVVTNEAARQSRQRARHFKKHNPGALVMLAGCYPRAFPEEALQIEAFDLIYNTFKDENLSSLLQPYFLNLPGEKKELVLLDSTYERTRAVLKVQDGCESYCSYCIIPQARGKLKSKALSLVLSELEDLLAQGFKEIVLTGIHLGHYGHDLQPATSLFALVERILEETKLPRLRLSSLEITDLEQGLLELFAQENSLCAHLHLPLQSASNKILKAMNRQYSREEYIKRSKEVLAIHPDMALTTDIMVGFPAEGVEEFEETIECVKEIAFSQIHVFPYSRRIGTKASLMDKQVPRRIKKERAHRLRILGDHYAFEFKKRFLEENLEVLLESYDESSGYYLGTTSNYIKVYCSLKKKHDLGTITQVKAVSLYEEGLLGMEV